MKAIQWKKVFNSLSFFLILIAIFALCSFVLYKYFIYISLVEKTKNVRTDIYQYQTENEKIKSEVEITNTELYLLENKTKNKYEEYMKWKKRNAEILFYIEQ